MSTLQPVLAEAGTVASLEGALASIEARLEGMAALLEEQEQRRSDLEEVVSDIMPALNGMLRVARGRLQAMEKSGALDLLPVARRGLVAVRERHQLRPVGVLGLVRALRDPDVGRGLALLLELLRAIGCTACPGEEEETRNGGGSPVAPSPDRRNG